MENTRKYLSIDDIGKYYLPISKKKIRAMVKENLDVTMIGGRMYVDRIALENLLSNSFSK